jgi:lipopolysaccharide/colanic/teichoic acid biosynthesis glycosyltransferase
MPDEPTATRTAVFEASIVSVMDETPVIHTEPVLGAREQGMDLQPEALLHEQVQTIKRIYDQAQPSYSAKRPGTLYRISKRAFDLMICVPALIVLSPLFVVVAILIRLDSAGPALFVQHRIGQNARVFRMYKFRTMTNGCGIRREPNHKHVNDNRITRVGRLLRQSSIDELPQLLNVALGHMSLVGPRPEIPSVMVDNYEVWQYQRLTVPQGITGWWQVTGRGKKLLWKHTEDDLHYIEHASFWFDLKLLFLTFRAVLSRNGAF